MESTEDSVCAYIQEVNKFPSITSEEEKGLIKLMKKGDQEAKEKIITSYLRLVVKLALEVNDSSLSKSDLIAEGNLGLLQAVERYDPDKGTTLGSFAAWWIKQAIRKAIREKGRTIKKPAATTRKVKKLQKIRNMLKETLGREPSENELSVESGLGIREVFRLLQADLTTTSLHIPISSDEGTLLEDIIPDKNSFAPDHESERNDEKARLEEIIGELGEYEQDILSLRFGLGKDIPKTINEVAKEFDCTSEYIQQIETNALTKLRNSLSRAKESKTS